MAALVFTIFHITDRGNFPFSTKKSLFYLTFGPYRVNMNMYGYLSVFTIM